MDKESLLASFLAVTGSRTEEAQHFLDAAGWDVDRAVQLFFEDGARTAVADPGLAAASLEGLGAAAAARAPEEDGTRLPDAPVRDRLLGNAPVDRMRAFAAAHHPDIVDNPFGQESAAADADCPTLNSIYSAPADLLNAMTLEELKAEAVSKDRWMLVNVQDPKNFRSLELNADLWGDATVKAVVLGNFQFAQRSMPTNDAVQLQQAYGLVDFPAIMVLDPITGQKMMQWTGNVRPSAFLEDLLPFMDKPPSSPDAGSLMRQVARPGPMSSTVQLASGGTAPPGVSAEDAEVGLAIAQSLAEAGGAAPPLDFMDDDTFAAQAAALAARSAAAAGRPGPSGAAAAASGTHDVAAAAADAEASGGGELEGPAAPAHPTPPYTGGGPPCKLAIRLPTGQRHVESFDSLYPVQALYDAVSTVLIGSSEGREFELLPAGPGQKALVDRHALIQDACVNGSLLQVRLQ